MEIRTYRDGDGDRLRTFWLTCGMKIRPGDDDASLARFAGRRAKLVMREKIDGQGYFKGQLGGLEDGPVKYVLIEGEDKRTHRVPLDVITRANLEVDF